MTLLDQEVNNKPEAPKGKKIVLILLILAIILLIVVIAMMFVLSQNQAKALTLSVNGSNVAIENDLLITSENGTNYVSIEKMSKLLGYDYLKGGYKEYTEDETNSKCYLQNEDQIIQFEADSNKISKTSSDSILDYEEYQLKNKIIKSNDLLYISLDDVNVGLEVVYTYSQENNQILFNTIENVTESYKNSLATQTNNQLLEISEEVDNEKALLYNMMVVANESKKWGVVDGSYSTIIGNRYTSLKFVESAGVFIASDENKYGVISKEPNQRPIIDLNYEEINVINNSPVYYQVKLAGKYGVINGQGKATVNNIYDSMGYISKSTNEISLLMIEDYGANKDNLLVVCKNGKYGLVNIDSGQEVIGCVLDKIYGKKENGTTNYYIGLQQQEISLDRYIEYINTSTINVGR